MMNYYLSKSKGNISYFTQTRLKYFDLFLLVGSAIVSLSYKFGISASIRPKLKNLSRFFRQIPSRKFFIKIYDKYLNFGYTL
jgi:hypothetical protein